ncbi:MAG: hypothetical protein M3443_04410 [Actinomycetota bacterium]|nr:hypothetical protein [Actinomycetota bacterium]
MWGHLEAAAEAFNTASQQVPLEYVVSAREQMSTVAQMVQQGGGQSGQEMAQNALAIQAELNSVAGRLQELRQRLDGAAQAAMRGGL